MPTIPHIFPEILRKRWVLILILAAVVFCLYSFMLQGDFKTGDDYGSIVTNRLLWSFRHTGEIFRSSYFGANAYYRPLTMFSYLLEYQAWGLDAYNYYLTNIVLHILTVTLAFLILCRLMPGGTGPAFAAAFFYAIHPVHWEPVANIPGRAILLCGLLVFATFYLFLQRKRHVVFYLLSFVTFFLALLSKESAGVFPLVILSYQFFLGREKQDRLLQSPCQGSTGRPLAGLPRFAGRPVGLQWVLPAVPYFLLVIPYIWLRWTLKITELFYVRIAGESVLGFLTFLRGLIMFVRLFFFPVDLHFDRSAGLVAGLVNFDVLLVVVFYGAAAWLIWRFRRKISPVTWFLFSWFLIELLPVSQVLVSIGVQPGRISLAEHFLYVPAFGFWGVMIIFGQNFAAWNARRKMFSSQFLWLAVFFFAAYLMVKLVEYNIYASNEVAMIERSLKVNPVNGRMQLSLANAYAKQRRFAEAEQSFRQALFIDPNMHVRAQIGVGKALCDQGKYWECLEVYDQIQDPLKLKDLLIENRRLTLAVLRRKYEALVREDPRDPQNVYALGIVLDKSGEVGAARDLFRRAVELKPDFREAWFNLATDEAKQENWDLAVAAYQKVLDLSRDDDMLRYQAHAFLAKIYAQTGDELSADTHWREAARLLAVIEAEKK